MRVIIFICLLNCCFTGCKKQPGEGGTSSISGKVWVEDWNTPFSVKNGEYPGVDEDVYIIFGDDLSYGEKTATSYTGEYEFKNLRKGKYKLYVYSKDKKLESPSGEVAIVQEIEITQNKKLYTAETFTIFE